MPGRILQELHEYPVTGLPLSTILYHAGRQIGLRSTNLVIRKYPSVLFLNVSEDRLQMLLVRPLDEPFQIRAQTCDLRLSARESPSLPPVPAPIFSFRI